MKYIKHIIISFLVLILFGVVIFVISTNLTVDQKSALETTLLRGGLADLPPHTGLHIEKLGSSLSREFVIEFDADTISIDHWVNNSKRLKDSSPFVENDTIRYDIFPGEGGAIGGTVVIDGKSNHVRIDMSWS